MVTTAIPAFGNWLVYIAISILHDHELQPFLLLFDKNCPLGKLDLLNNYVICLMTTIHFFVELGLTELMTTTIYDRSSGPNFGCKSTTICTGVVEIPIFIIYVSNIGWIYTGHDGFVNCPCG